MPAKFKVDQLRGIDSRPNSNPEWAQYATNLRYDATTSAWRNDRGFISWFPAQPSLVTGRVTSMYYHQVGDATTDLLVEIEDANSSTISVLDSYDSNGLVTVAANRAKLRPGMPGTSYASFGGICVAVNGVDAPLKIYPRWGVNTVRTEPFGFQRRPGTPIPLVGTRGDMGSVALLDLIYATSLETRDVTVAYPADTNTIGLGDPTYASQSSYRYAYSWVTDTGSESPLSDLSATLVWTQGADVATVPASSQAYRYGVVLTNIEPGPPGTVKRRIYRSRNIKTGQTQNPELYFLTELPNNFETAFGDHVPDNQLGDIAPNNSDSYPIPAQTRLIASHAGRCFLVSQDYIVLWSHAGKPEQFGLEDYVDVGSRAGGRITGLVPYNDMLVILRENAIDAITYTGGTFQAVPLTTSVGSRAPHAAIVVPDWGLLFAANDGIYQLQGNLSGGGTVHVQKLTTLIEPLWQRVNPVSMAASQAWYNPTDREVTWALPVQALASPEFHIVLHLDLGNAPPSFTLRPSTSLAVGSTNPEGTVTLGYGGVPLLGGNTASVMTWGAYDQYGYSSGATALARPPATWTSTDLDLNGDPDQVKVVTSINLNLDTNGAKEIRMDVYPDYGWTSTGNAVAGTYVYDRPLFSVYGEAVVGTDTYGKTGVTQVRFDFNPVWCRRIRFSITSTAVFAIHGYSIEFDNKTGPGKPFNPAVAAGSVPASMRP